MLDSLEILRKRLKYRSWHRGTREMDLILGRFADKVLDDYPEKRLLEYAALLEFSDPDLYDWVSGKVDFMASPYAAILKDLTAFHLKNLRETL